MNSKGPCETFMKSVGYETQDGNTSEKANETISKIHEAPITRNKRRKRKNLHKTKY